MFELKNKKVLVLGMGDSGVAASGLLRNRGADVMVSDGEETPHIRERANILEQQGIKCEIGGHSKEFFEGAELVVVSPGIDITRVGVQDLEPLRNIPIIGELELASMFCPCPMVAVTGTNGKSTTVSLIGDILRQYAKDVQVAGNIGTPFASIVDDLTTDSIAIIEVSSFQLETIKTFRPHIAVLLNISDDHFDRHVNIHEYSKQKFKIFMNQEEQDYAVIYDVFRDSDHLKNIKSKKIFYPRENIKYSGLEDIVNSSPLEGVHNRENVACCVIVANLLGVPIDVTKKAVDSFASLPHRVELVRDVNGVKYIDDSKATNIDATKRAIESIDGQIILIAGGKDKGGEYGEIREVISKKIKTLIVVGEAANKINDAYKDSTNVVFAENMDDAVKRSGSEAGGTGTVLLSPMCSSFDMYKSYKERGNDFIKCVKAL
jgi:UDP-N-acetylmuramoylalanine--D-glutamate ligase